MNLPREDAYCPACPDPDAGAVRIRVTRRMWEPVMMGHLESEDDDEHRRLYDECTTALVAMGVSVEESARNSVQAAARSVTQMLGNALRRAL